MKSSNVEWIKVIPDDWTVVPLKSICSFSKGLSITKENLSETGMPVISYGQIHSKKSTGTHVIPELIRFVPDSYIDSNAPSLAENGDVIFADTSEDFEGIGNALLIDTDYPIFAGYHTIIVHPKDRKNGKYLAYLFLTDCWREQLRAMAAGIKVYSVTQKMLRSSSVILPTSTEQSAITTFLDRKVTHIDSIIAEARASIEEYKSWKASIIYEAVTKGLDKDVEMKDSGVEWIGEIPITWEVIPFTKGIDSIVDYRGKTPEKTTDGVFLVTARNIKDGKINYSLSAEYVNPAEYEEIMHRGKPEIGDVLFTTEAPLGEVANVDRTGFALAQRVIKFRCNPQMLDNYFLKYWIMSQGFQQNLYTFATGSTAKGIKASKLGQLKVVMPSIEEQLMIVSYLDNKWEAINSLIAEKESLISDLEAYKKSLIFEVVTGKRKVV